MNTENKGSAETYDLQAGFDKVTLILSRQQPVCTGLSILLTYILDRMAGAISPEYFDALTGSAYLLDLISKDLTAAYNLMDEMSTKITEQK